MLASVILSGAVCLD